MKRLQPKNKTLTQIVKEQCWISRPSEGQGHNAQSYVTEKVLT